MDFVSEKENILIEHNYKNTVNDILLKQKFENLEKSIPWKSIKNNNKTNKLKKTHNIYNYNIDPYKFLNIPTNIRLIIKNLCNTNDISLQRLAVKTNLSLSLIDNYLNNNYPIDNYYLDIILRYFEFDLINYVKIDNNK